MKHHHLSIIRLVALLAVCLMCLSSCGQEKQPNAPSAPTAEPISLVDDSDAFALKAIPAELMPTDKKIVVWMWGDGEEYQKYYNGFLADYPEYELEFKVPATGDHVQLTEAVLSGVGIPDAVLVAPRPADAYYTGLYQPLDFYMRWGTHWPWCCLARQDICCPARLSRMALRALPFADAMSCSPW